MLVKGGADVAFLVRPRRAAQLAERGLEIKMPDGEYRAPVKTVLSSSGGGPYDVAFVACKAYGLDAAIDDFAPALSSGGAVRAPRRGSRTRRRDSVFGCADAGGRHLSAGYRENRTDLGWRTHW